MNTQQHKLTELQKFEDYWGALSDVSSTDDVSFETTLEGFSMRTIASNFFTHADLMALNAYSIQNAMRYTIWSGKGSMTGTYVVCEFETAI